MPARIRLARHGRKRKAFYHIVVADSRAPRDGRFIERIGSYDPNTNPATIDLNFDRALDWLFNGAQPTDTCRAILSYKGVLMKKHLLEGVKKGAFDEAAAEEKFAAWLSDKESKIQAKIESISKSADQIASERLEAERKVNEARAQEIAKRRSDLAAEAEAEQKADETEEAGAVEETAEAAEEPAVEEPKKEEPKAEEPKKEESKAEEPKAEEPKAEEPKAEEPKAEEPKAEEKKVEEPKKEEPKTEEPKAEEPKAEEPKAEEPKAEEKKEDNAEGEEDSKESKK